MTGLDAHALVAVVVVVERDEALPECTRRNAADQGSRRSREHTA
jgi:hypothetical protein